MNAPAGYGFEAGAMVPITTPPVELSPDEELDARMRQFLGTLVNEMLTNLVKRTTDPAALGRRVYALLYVSRHHSVYGLGPDELAKRLGISRQRFWKLIEEIEQSWGLKAPREPNC